MPTKPKAKPEPVPDPTPTWAEIRALPREGREALLGEQEGEGDPERYARLVGIPKARTPTIEEQPPRY